MKFSSLSFSDPLLFVNVDISDCYDTIDSQKLFNIMEQVLATAAHSDVCLLFGAILCSKDCSAVI